MAEAQWQIQITASDATANVFSALQGRVKQAQGVMDGLTKSVEAVKTAAAGFAGLKVVEWFKDTAKAAAEVEELGKKLGFTSDEIEAMQKSAASTGQTFDQQTDYFKTHRKELEEMTAAYKAQGQIMSGPTRAAFADVNQQLEVFGRTISTVRAQFEGGTLDKGISGIAAMIKDMGASLAYFETYKGTINSVRELMAIFTGAGGVTGVTAEMRATKQIDDLRASSVEATVALQKAQSELKALESTPAVNNPFAKQRDAIMGGTSGPLETARRRVEEAKALSEIANKQLADAEAAFAKGKKAIDTAQEDPARPVPVIPPPMSYGSNAGEDSAAKKLGILIAERQALERAMSQFRAAFEARQTDTVEEVDKKLQRSVDLEKQIATLTKNVGRDSTLGQQLTTEATALADLNTKYEEYRRIVTAAEQTSARYGDGSRELARTQKELGKQLAENQISQEAYNWAMKDAAEKAKQQELAARGAAGGFGAFSAGIESVLRPANQMSREFIYGQKAMSLLDDAISQMVQNGEINFNKLLGSFLLMIAQMEARAAVSTIWGMLGGSTDGGAGGGIAGALIGGISSIVGGAVGSAFGPSLSTLQGGIGPGGQVLLFADGGRPPVGRASIVGEQGPELFVPDSAGTILNQEQLSGMGGGTTVIVQQTVHVGEFVTTSQYAAGLRAVEQSARQGAMAGIINQRKRGGLKDVFN